MNNWIVKIVRNELGEIVDRLPQYIVKGTPFFIGEHIIVSGEATKYPKLVEELDENGSTIFRIIDDSPTQDPEDIATENYLQRLAIGRKIIARIAVRNIDKGLSKGQVKQLMDTYSDINTALLNGSLELAKELIEAVVPDGTLITQADKDKVIEKINEAIS